MKKGRFLWSAHRITKKQKAGKARNIKEKQLKNSRNTVSRQLVEHLSSARDNRTVIEIAGKPWKHHVSGVFLFALETRWNGGKPGENHRISSAFVTRLQQKYLYSRVLFMASIRIRTSRWV